MIHILLFLSANVCEIGQVRRRVETERSISETGLYLFHMVTQNKRPIQFN